MNLLEKRLQKIEKILDKAWRDPDEAAVWHLYGFTPESVSEFIDMGVTDPHTAEALDKLGVRPGLLKRTREQLKAKIQSELDGAGEGEEE